MRLPLIYIVGMGRSGSTLLDMLLGSHKQIANTGEFINFAKWLAEDENCTCNNKIRLCPVWSAVISNAPLEAARQPLTPTGTGKLWSIKQVLFTILRRSLKHPDLEIAHRNHKLLQELLRTTGTIWVVDSSKSFNRLCFLERSGLFDLKVIHLVRDGRGVANSKKTRKYPIRQLWNLEAKKLRPVGWTTGYWVLTNLICMLLNFTCFKNKSILVRYEDLCTSPNKEMTRILDFLGLRPDHDYTSVPPGVYHNVAGNYSRFNADRRISLDRNWVKGLTSRDKFIFTIVGGWMNILLGFGLFSNKTGYFDKTIN